MLQECMEQWGGFDHNAQTLRILSKLERRHAEFEGLNLTWETLEGVVKHNGPLVGHLADQLAQAKGQAAAKPLPAALEEYASQHDLLLNTFPSLEAQVAALADDIAYNNHDVDDGLRAGLFSLEDAMDVPLIGEAIRDARRKFPDCATDLLIAEAVSDMIGEMVADVFAETGRRLAELAPASADDIRTASRPMVAFSDPMHEKVEQLRAFLWDRMYRHWKVNRARSHAKRVVRELFDLFMEEPEMLPPEWRGRYEGVSEAKCARAVCDYIAGMTDRFALREHRELFPTESWI